MFGASGPGNASRADAQLDRERAVVPAALVELAIPARVVTNADQQRVDSRLTIRFASPQVAEAKPALKFLKHRLKCCAA
jgi:hypothetical protein